MFGLGSNTARKGAGSSQIPVTREDLQPLVECIERIAKGDFAFTIEEAPEDSATHDLTVALRKQQHSLAQMICDLSANSTVLSNASNDLDKTAAMMLQNTGKVDEQAESVARATEEMSENMSSISAASEELSTNIQTISERAISSAENVNSVASATEEMTATVKDIARNTDEARHVAENAVNNVELATEKVLALEEAANEINNVITAISDISDQTKLLALNATIEAARAGEAGKGFAVVAGEVKGLAQQTNTATNDIRDKIEAMQNATRETIGEIGKIKEVISDVSHIVSTIASAVEEQSATTEDIASNVSHAAGGINDMSRTVSEGAAAVQEVNEKIAGAAELARDVAASINEVKNQCANLKSDSTFSYASSMEVSSKVSDNEKRIDMIKLPPNLKNQSENASSALFSFTDAWSVLVADMDEQHKRIFDYINQIHAAIKARKNNRELLPIVEGLNSFTTKHFDQEERLMRDKRYPELANQEKAHEKLLSRVREIITSLKEDSDNVNMIEVMVFLKEWLQNHILKMDKGYGAYFDEKGLL